MNGKRFLSLVALIMAVLGVASPIFTPKPALAGGNPPIIQDWYLEGIEYWGREVPGYEDGFDLPSSWETITHSDYPEEYFLASEIDFSERLPSRILNNLEESVPIPGGAQRFVTWTPPFPPITARYKYPSVDDGTFIKDDTVFAVVERGGRAVLKYLHDDLGDGRRVKIYRWLGGNEWEEVAILPEGWVRHFVVIFQEPGRYKVEWGDSVGVIQAEYFPYEICSEMGPWEEVGIGNWFWDSSLQNFVRYHYWERYDAWYPEHICNTAAVPEEYVLCSSDLTDERLDHVRREWDEEEGKYKNTYALCRYDLLYEMERQELRPCQCGEEVVWEDYIPCSETEVIPEAERGSWELAEELEGGTRRFRRPLTRDVHTGQVCEYEYREEGCAECTGDRVIPVDDAEWETDPEDETRERRAITRDSYTNVVCTWEYRPIEEPTPTPRDKTYVSTVLPETAIGKTVRYFMVAGGYSTTHTADWDQWRRAAVLDIFWIPPGEKWSLGIELPPGYEVAKVERDGRPYGGYTKDPLVVTIETNHQYQVFCRRKK